MAQRKVKRVRPWRTGRRVFRVLAVLFILVVSVVGALMTPAVQTYLAQQLSTTLSAELGAELRIGRVELRLFGANRLHGVFIADLNGDTLVAADEIWVRGLRIHPDAHVLEAKRVELHRSRFALARAADDPHSNLTNLLEKLSSPSGSDTTTSAPWSVRVAQVDIRDLHFSHHDGHHARLPFGVDVSHVDIPDANIIGRDFLLAGDSILFRFDQLALTEQSGLVIKQLAGSARVAPRGIKVDRLHLITGGQHPGSTGSDIRGDIDLRSKSLAEFEYYNTKVFMSARLDSSRLQFADVALFAPDLEGVDYLVAVSGKVQGRVNELKGRDMDLYFGKRSIFRGDIEMTGLPDFPNTFIVLDASSIRTDPGDLSLLPVPPFTSKATLVLPPEVERLGRLSFSGNFTGFINSFTTYGSATTEAGTLRSDISFERDTVTKYFELRGKLATDGFDLGKVLQSKAVGRIALDTKVAARGRDLNTMEAEIEGTVPELGLAHYTIGGITLNGKLEKNLFNGELHCRDPKLNLDFNGLADLRGRWPDVDFTADVRRMDLRALGLIGGDGYSDVAMQINAKGQLAPDSLQGKIRLREVSYCEDSIDLHLGDIALDAWRDKGVPMVKLESTVADAMISGPFYPTLLPGAFQSVIFSIFPSMQEQVKYDQEEQNFTFDATLKEARSLLELVVPGLDLAAGTHATGRFNSRTFDLGLDAHLPTIGYMGYSGDSLDITLGKTMDLVAFSIKGNGKIRKDSSVTLSDLYITGTAYQDEIRLRADWAGEDSVASGTVNLNALVKGPASVLIDIEPSSVDLGQGIWHNERTAHIQVDSSTITIDTLLMLNQVQAVRLGGTIGRDPGQALSFELQDVRSENLKPLYDGPVVHGAISGDGRIFDLYGKPYLLSYLCVDSLAIADKPVGDLRLAATYNEGGDAIDVNGSLQRDTLRAFDFSGKVNPGKDQELDLKLRMDRFDLRFIDPYLPEAISEIQGKVTGVVDITGKLNDPQINGSATLENAGLRVNYLNTFYSFSHKVDIKPDMFALDQVLLHDDEGHTATANGTIIHHGLKDWNFDVSMDVDNMKVLDTDARRNELYYGKAYAMGILGISGYADNLEINVDAATGPGTDIHFPLGASQEVGGISFVRFTGNGISAEQSDQAVDLSGIRLDMKVAVTPDARFELIFDPTVGDIMRGRGNGNIAMAVTPSGDFSMKGDVELVDGDYLFTLRNLVNKRFGVEPGGHITWYGDPFNAIIDVDAVYRLRASLYDVIPPALRTEAYKKRFPVEVLMHLSQNLMNPEIGFDVRLPSVDEGVRTQVNSALATPDDMNKQVFSLIVLNRFLPSDATGGPSDNSGLGGATAATGTELLSNQLSNWLSSFSSNFDLGVNWRTGDVISQDEVELAVSTAIFNDRLQLNTNVGVAYGAGGTQQGSNTVIGDFSAEYSLTQDGKLRFKAFSQSNDRNLNQVDQAQTTQGAGLAYREEFDTLGEFFRKVTTVFRKKDKK